MTKISTKKALTLSLLSMLLCVSMLVGSTFAWFTDTATASVNNIQSGTLDVELQMATEWETDGTVKTWESAEGKTLNFKKATGAPSGESVLWEPGCTYELPELKVVNKGNLALKYKILITGIKGSAELNDVIDWTISGDELGKEYTLEANKESSVLKISGHMQETAGNDYQDKTIDGIAITVVATQYNYEYDSTNNTYDKDAVLPVASTAKGNLTVTQNTDGAKAVVSGDAQELSDSVMSVTYPNGVILSTTTVSSGTDSTKKTTVEQKLEYVDDKASDAMSAVSITADKAVASYTLTLPVDSSNQTLVTVTINYAANLTGVQIYHSGALLAGSAAAEGETAHEYAEYNSGTGVITLHLFHASPIDIVYNKPKQLPAGAKVVSTIDELETAVGALHDGDYIALGADIATGKASGQITFIRAEDAEGDITATLDMNGHVFRGQIGGFSFANEGITVNVYGNEKAVAEFYKHKEGHLVNTFAVFNYSGKTVLKDGLFTSNNLTIGSYGGEIVVDGGEVEANGEGTVCLYAVNAGVVTINGGSFTSEASGALMLVESTSSDPTIVINNGTFTAAGNAFVFKKTSTSCNKCKITINGGNFTLSATDGIVGWTGDGATEEWAKQFISITGGTFNVDPSAYVASGYEAVKNDTAGTWTVKAK